MTAQPNPFPAFSTFDMTEENGFLPIPDPLTELPNQFSTWDETANELPKLIVTDRIRSILEKLPQLDVSPLTTKPELERAMMVLSYLGHSYVWGETQPPKHIPACLAVPWQAVAKQLGRPPVLSYASYALWNWRRTDLDGPIALGNISLRQNFMAGIDEEWFILIHVDIEKKAAPALAVIPTALAASANEDSSSLKSALQTIGSSLEQMNAVMDRMPEHCDPYIYYNRVRPYIHGWKNHPLVPQGISYESVDDYGGKPQQFRGETGAQSSIVPALDAVLGIHHKDDPLRQYLNEMRDYMPPQHRAFIEEVEKRGSVRDAVTKLKDSDAELKAAYNHCVEEVQKFRTTHLDYAASYIDKQKQISPTNPTKVGTGGTPFLQYLKKHRDESSDHLL